MGYLEAKSVPANLRNHYEKLLFPYDVFQSGLMTGADSGPPEVMNITFYTKFEKQGQTKVIE